jgi:hypothetical protein
MKIVVGRRGYGGPLIGTWETQVQAGWETDDSLSNFPVCDGWKVIIIVSVSYVRR